jgi:hypothetical protein
MIIEIAYCLKNIIKQKFHAWMRTTACINSYKLIVSSAPCTNKLEIWVEYNATSGIHFIFQPIPFKT